MDPKGLVLVVARFVLGGSLFVAEVVFVGLELLDGWLHEHEVAHEVRRRQRGK